MPKLKFSTKLKRAAKKKALALAKRAAIATKKKAIAKKKAYIAKRKAVKTKKAQVKLSAEIAAKKKKQSVFEIGRTELRKDKLAKRAKARAKARAKKNPIAMKKTAKSFYKW